MATAPYAARSSPLGKGLGKFPPNVHGNYVEHESTGNTVLTVR